MYFIDALKIATAYVLPLGGKGQEDVIELLARNKGELRRVIGKKLNLFHTQEEAPGMVFWHPRGWRIYQAIEQVNKPEDLTEDGQFLVAEVRHLPHPRPAGDQPRPRVGGAGRPRPRTVGALRRSGSRGVRSRGHHHGGQRVADQRRRFCGGDDVEVEQPALIVVDREPTGSDRRSDM